MKKRESFKKRDRWLTDNQRGMVALGVPALMFLVFVIMEYLALLEFIRKAGW